MSLSREPFSQVWEQAQGGGCSQAMPAFPTGRLSGAQTCARS